MKKGLLQGLYIKNLVLWRMSLLKNLDIRIKSLYYTHTDAAKRIAEHRQAVMEEYLEEFVAEWEGER